MYDHKNIEKKWQKIWDETKAFKTTEHNEKKAYILDMFPYPSGAGLHVGHPEGYTATDIVSRYKRLNGYDVLHPIGWDAFGLPAEQYALKTGNHPAIFTEKNIENFKKQIKMLGFSYDFDKEINTSKPEYYVTTQWIFKELYKHGLASIENVDVNWCEGLGTVLANEEVLETKDGKKVSERGNFPVTKKPMKQWVLKITKYAEKLLEGLEDIDWTDSLKALQRNWIGKSEGTEISFWVQDTSEYIRVFTTRPDTIFGVSYVCIAPEHPLINKIVTSEHKKEVEDFIAKVELMSQIDRTNDSRVKNGVFTGSYVLHPMTDEPIPVYVADYVLGSYGTGAVMAVPAHDQRDYEFAQRYNLPMIQVLEGDISEKAMTEDAKHINSEFLNGLNIEEATKNINKFLVDNMYGKVETKYKLRDWIFSRQRYWGEPFPVLFDEDGKVLLIEDLVELPNANKIEPSGTGESPLANLKDWLWVEIDGVKYRHDTNTMPQWAGSSWYFLAYILKNEDGTYTKINSPEAKKRFAKWLPVDLYIGGQEHATLHLLYARFWHRFLYDIGVVTTKEPFAKLINQGMILGTDGQKMSKSLGNVINPDDIVEEFGADTLRIYEMFMGPLTDTKTWNTTTLKGTRKWLDRIDSQFTRLLNNEFTNVINEELNSELHVLIKEFTECIEKLKFNIAISKMMVFINYLAKLEQIPDTKCLKDFLIMLSTFAPHFAEEWLEKLGEKQIQYQTWPQFDESLIIEKKIFIGVQINGKVRGELGIEEGWTEEDVIKAAQEVPSVIKHIENKQIIKVIYKENTILNIICK
ncbi:leucine--tRNA ligase [Mycoplasma phocoenae]|uniref:Leucine--tRNA ligase n=1 Tax=Mycoplasma phocoenae TaxID=754517 RepID=A0A858U401_9MOLU|nr:leucine--tRNA ligase [Mycoplasma phocoenae]QJG66789.1 leucine--tRNA ligase [Mycoplasma phocoenae]